MAVFKCKMCGGKLEVQEGMTICECEYCGSTQTIPTLDDEKKIKLFTRANRLRGMCEFDKAAGVYESIIAEFQEEAEAYWGLILCKFGIEYVDDPNTGKKIPTCHRSSFDAVMDDSNFELVLEYSDPTSRAVYRDEAKVIEELRIGIIGVSSEEEPYDIFICYKETDAVGERTIDSVIAQDVYDVLVEKGYRVFFSRITLEDKLGQEYEPYIFAALNSAKVMLAFGTDYEYYSAVWVKNEWSRFLSLIEKGVKKTLIPCYKGIDAYDMPREFARLQAQDMGKVGAIQDLVRGIGKIIGTNTPLSTTSFRGAVSAEGSVLVQRGTMALEDGDFKSADNYFERALDVNPSDAQAYLGKFLAFYGLTSLSDLDDKICNIEDSKAFKRAEQFADSKLAKELAIIKEENQKKIERLRLNDALKKYLKMRGKEYITERKKEAFEGLLQQSVEGEKRARVLFASLMETNFITPEEHRVFTERVEIIKGIAKVLSDCEMHEYSASGESGVSLTLRELEDLKCIEKHALGYCLNGAKEEKDRLLREARERRQKEERQNAAYEAAYEQVEEQIQNEVRPISERISEEYDSQIRGIEREMNEAVSSVNRQRESIQNKIQDLNNRKASLGLFKGKEKKAVQAEIDIMQTQLNVVASEQQVRGQYQPSIEQISQDKNNAISVATKEVRVKYTMPRFEDFADV